MPRISRQSYRGLQIFHIMTQGIKKEYIFADERKKYEYIKLINKYRNEYSIGMISYCIMNNHAHMIIKTAQIESMTNFMHKVNTAYGIYYNKSLDRVGYVFRNRFKAQAITDINYLYNCILYVHNNPVKAGICRYAKEYRFSSYLTFIKDNKKIFDRLFKTGEQYDLAHNNNNQNMYFIEDEDDRDRQVIKEITTYLTVNNKTKSDLKVDNKTLVPIAKRLRDVYNLSNRSIGYYLDVSGEKVRYILK